MPKIRKLPDSLVSQIAAGEVIERPAYAVKELIENAIDAKAKHITIVIGDSGLQEITVLDDGTGMKKEDLLECFKPHTTSKIYREDDLHSISTMGFRGEALSSIASVSNLTIQSRHKREIAGTKVVISNGTLKQSTSIGMPHGTIVSANNLFATIPARKKFLKSPKTEFRHISDIVTNFILSYPSISFTFNHNKKHIITFTANHTLERRIQNLFGQSIFENLLPLSFNESYVFLEGFISRPQSVITGQSKVFVFVNGRRIYNPLFLAAIKEGYKNLLESASYPISFIYIKVPHEMVDVNIHPRKEQVNFIDQTLIFDAISKAVDHTLQNNNLTFFNVNWKDSGTKTYLGKALKNELFENVSNVDKTSDIIQIHNLYLITATQKGILFIDQHAAHEALLFRKLKNLFEQHQNRKLQFDLTPPLLITVPFNDKEIIEEHLTFFNGLGFEIEEFGEQIRVNKIPSIFKDRNIQELIFEFIEEIRSEKPIRNMDSKSYRMLSYLACRSAIKKGDILSKGKMKELIQDLTNEDMLYTCPHGRPVKIEMSMNYLDVLFKRR